MQLMPGFQKSGEGNAAIYVRGGGYDHFLDGFVDHVEIGLRGLLQPPGGRQTGE